MSKRLTTIICSAALIVLTCSVFGYSISLDTTGQKVDALFADVDQNTSPGAAVVIIRDGRVIYEHGYGMADLENQVRISPTTIFHVGSLSKQFTAMAIQLLVRDGKISLADDVRKFVPELHDFGKPITIANLLNHTSGLREQLQLLFMSGWRLEDVITQDDLFRVIRGQRELNFAPGDQYLYSNTNYTLLAMIVERVSGRPLAQIARESIFEPLGMRNTAFRDDYRTVVKNLAPSYVPTAQGVRHMFLSSSYVGPSGLMTTAEDLALWDRNFYTSQVGGPETIGRMAMRGKLNSGRSINYASGLNVGEYRGLRTIEHSGEDAGYESDLLRFPDRKFSVIVLSNSGGVDAVSAAFRIADLYLAEDFKEAKAAPDTSPVKEISVTAQALDKYAGDYQLPFGSTARLAVKSGRLTIRIKQEPEQILLATSAGGFSTADRRLILSFSPPEHGKSIRFSINSDGWERDGEKLENIALTASAAAAFAGSYYCPELNIVYSTDFQTGKLRLSHRRGVEPLVPKHQDEFVTGFSAEARRWRGGEYARLKFLRDRQGRVSGFLLSMPSARNVRFIKLGKL